MKAAARRLFISYRREETAGHAGRLYDAVAARFGERNVFMDVDLAPGIDFVEQITEAVGACDVLLVVIGPSWATTAGEKIQSRCVAFKRSTMSAIRTGRPRSIRARSVMTRSALNGSPVSATVGGWMSGSGSPGGAGRRGPRPGAASRTSVTQISD